MNDNGGMVADNLGSSISPAVNKKKTVSNSIVRGQSKLFLEKLTSLRGVACDANFFVCVLLSFL